MKSIYIISCVGTIICALFAYLAYKNAKAVNIKSGNKKEVNFTGNKNKVQIHEGTGDNIGRDKNG